MFSFYYKNIPSVEIYFYNPLKNYISKGRVPFVSRSIRRLGPYSFYANGRAVIIRYITDRELRKIRALKPQRCYYIIDDDLHALGPDQKLPDDYRARLASFAERQLPKILTLADTIIAPNPRVHAAYPDKKHLLLNPSYTRLCRDFSHFENPAAINILFAGTRSHLTDLSLVSDTIAGICRRLGHVTFTTFLGSHAPASLQGLSNITHHPPLSWSRYKRLFETSRYHIAIAPVTRSAFNRARSINKLLDHAAFGAAGLYSDQLPISGIVDHGQNGLLVADQAGDWQGEIEKLISDVPQAGRLAKAGASLAGTIGDPVTVRDFWLNELFGD